MSEQGACSSVAAHWLVPVYCLSAANFMLVAQLLARALCPVLAVLEHWVLQLSIQESLNVQSQFCHSGLTTCSQSLSVSTHNWFLVQSEQPACDKHITCKCYLWPWCCCPGQPDVSSRAVWGIANAVLLVAKGKWTSDQKFSKFRRRGINHSWEVDTRKTKELFKNIESISKIICWLWVWRHCVERWKIEVCLFHS